MTSSESPPPRYRLKFLPDALDEWNALDGSVKEVLKKLLKKRLEHPRVPGAELHGDLRDCYKIKLRKQGYRLVYQVEDSVLTVLVLAVAKREDMAVYRAAVDRLLSGWRNRGTSPIFTSPIFIQRPDSPPEPGSGIASPHFAATFSHAAAAA